MCTRSLPSVAFSILLLSMTVAIGCTRQPPAEEAGPVRTEQKSSKLYVSTFTCREGEKQWHYICRVRHQPTPAGYAAFRPSRTFEQRVGVLIVGTYKGKLLFSTSPFPGEGPIPSLDEYPTWMRQVTQEAERKVDANRRTP